MVVELWAIGVFLAGVLLWPPSPPLSHRALQGETSAGTGPETRRRLKTTLNQGLSRREIQNKFQKKYWFCKNKTNFISVFLMSPPARGLCFGRHRLGEREFGLW